MIRRGVGAFVADGIVSLTQNQKEDLIKNGLINVISHAKELSIEKERFGILVEECWSE